MKKWIVFILLFIILLLAGIFLFIPSNTKIKGNKQIAANLNAASRHLLNYAQWASWWPGDSLLHLNDHHYLVKPVAMDVTEVTISGNKNITPGYIKFYPVSNDTISIVWQFELPGTSHPIERVKNYFYARALKDDVLLIIKSMANFIQTPQNLYGFDVQQTTVKDTLLVATRTAINHYPNTDEVYKLVDKLRKYIKQSNAKETNQPMLHINKVDSMYQYMVAIPVDKELPGQGDIQMKRMVPGNILVAEIKGGEATINEALQAFENLISDYKQTSPAIPFQLLVTNRQEVRDTSRWITKLYYPIF